MCKRRQPSLSTGLAVVQALALMRIELALNGLPGLFDGGVRPELSITGFTDADERGAFRHDSQIAFCHAQVSHGLGHHTSPVDIQTAPLPAVNGDLANFDTDSCYPALNFVQLTILRSRTPVLIELRLENYAVIDNLAVEFAPGLNLLTGETGAGKSILIDALALLLGDKASADVIRAGADKATISAVFEVEGGAEKTVARILENNGIDPDQEDESVILRREISAGGKGRVFVNNQPATVAVLRQLAPYLATIHAQNESLLSFDASTRLRLLDSFANVQLDPTAEAFSKWKNINSRIEELHRDEQDRLRLLEGRRAVERQHVANDLPAHARIRLLL